MEIRSADREEYTSIIKDARYTYNEVWFHDINRHKVEHVYYLLFKTSKYKGGVIVGVKNYRAMIPYSAPFSIIEKREEIGTEEIWEMICLLEEFLKEQSVKSIFFRLPPSFYDETFIAEIQNVMFRRKYIIAAVDLNYQYYLKNEQEYLERLYRNAKKNLNRALKCDWQFERCVKMEERKKTYEVIAINRKSKGYPLKMSWDDVVCTTNRVEHDFFLLRQKGEAVAAAIVFKVTDDVYQVIYWGDVPGYEQDRPMNYLAYRTYLYYSERGIRVLDIGPSTECGEPNYGLCNFKKSIGCSVSSKLTYIKEF